MVEKRVAGRSAITAVLIAIAAIAVLLPAHADRDIVFAAKYYHWSGHYYRDSYGSKPQETLARLGPSHIYRINPDGSRRTQLTFGKWDDIAPRWSPNGKQVLFVRYPENRTDKCAVCIMDENGDKIRRLFITNNSVHRYTWSPDGRWIALHVRDYLHMDYSVYVINARTGRRRKFSYSSSFAWSPDSRSLFLSQINAKPDCRLWSLKDNRIRKVSAPIWNPLWLDNGTIIGDLPTEDGPNNILRVISAEGGELRRIPIHPAVPSKTDDQGSPDYERQWYKIAKSDSLLIANTSHGQSDGHYYSCYLIDMDRGTWKLLRTGSLIGISPDGTRIATATAEWVGPYKRGGARVGPLEIISLESGKIVAITPPLVSIGGGDWRRTR